MTPADDTTKCSIPDCAKPRRQGVLCPMHYWRKKHHGDPLATTVRAQFRNPVDRFIEDVTLDDGCWLWTGATRKDGYGTMRAGGGPMPVHRFAYELLAGPIPEGLVIDHLCRTPACVRPDHLEPVTIAENTRRGVARQRRREADEARTTCEQGHPWVPENLYTNPATGARTCRICRRENGRRYYLARKAVSA